MQRQVGTGRRPRRLALGIRGSAILVAVTVALLVAAWWRWVPIEVNGVGAGAVDTVVRQLGDRVVARIRAAEAMLRAGAAFGGVRGRADPAEWASFLTGLDGRREASALRALIFVPAGDREAAGEASDSAHPVHLSRDSAGRWSPKPPAPSLQAAEHIELSVPVETADGGSSRGRLVAQLDARDLVSGIAPELGSRAVVQLLDRRQPIAAGSQTVDLPGQPWILSVRFVENDEAGPGPPHLTQAALAALALLGLALVWWLGVAGRTRGRLAPASGVARADGALPAGTPIASDQRQDVAEAHAAERGAIGTRRPEKRDPGWRQGEGFLAMLSHELRTPLNAIQGWAHILEQEGVAPATRQRGMDVIKRNVALQARLIDDLMDSARLAAGTLKLDLDAVDLGPLIEEILENVKPLASTRGVTLRATLECPQCLVTGDRQRLAQVVWHLATNAIKFTPPAGAVELRLERSDSTARLIVCDNGRGIAPGLMPHIFERFRQGEEPAGGVTRGVGLGLSLVRELVELHGGRVEATSRGDASGTAITVRLPILDPGDAHGAGRSGHAGRPSAGGRRLVDTAVLAIDDHDEALEALSAMLAHEGARTTTATSVPQALAGLASREPAEWPDVVVCDLSLPGVDGFEFLTALRALEARRGPAPVRPIPVIALTAFAQEPARARALDAGFESHVPKPVDADELVRAVLRALRAEPGRP